MPHISKKGISTKLLKDAELLLDSFLADASPKQRKQMFQELFSQTERTMLAKRLLMIYLIGRGVSGYKIERLLGVSQSTVGRFMQGIERKKFAKTVSILKINTPFSKMLHKLADLALIPFKARRYPYG